MQKLSYIHNPMKERFMYTTSTNRLRYWAHRDPDRDAFVFYSADGARNALSRKKVLESSIHLAKHFASLGLRKGDPVGFLLDSSLELFVCQFAVLFAGGVPFYMATALTDGSDVFDTLSKMEARFLILDPGKNNST